MLVKHKGTEQYFAMKILDKQKVSGSMIQATWNIFKYSNSVDMCIKFSLNLLISPKNDIKLVVGVTRGHKENK